MKRRDWHERRELKNARTASGTTSARLSKMTLEKARELERLPGLHVLGLDELVYELVTAELDRRKKR
jgi:hypothetical protein